MVPRIKAFEIQYLDKESWPIWARQFPNIRCEGNYVIILDAVGFKLSMGQRGSWLCNRDGSIWFDTNANVKMFWNNVEEHFISYFDAPFVKLACKCQFVNQVVHNYQSIPTSPQHEILTLHHYAGNIWKGMCDKCEKYYSVANYKE